MIYQRAALSSTPVAIFIEQLHQYPILLYTTVLRMLGRAEEKLPRIWLITSPQCYTTYNSHLVEVPEVVARVAKG
jgi:hypothetical protein